MTVSGMAKSSFVDFPGLVACVLFVPGCNYNCFYCHNRSLIDGTHEIMLPGFVEDFLKRRAGMLDGVVVSGGEPTLQPDLIFFMESLKSLGYKIKLDTNGSSPLVVREILTAGLCDYFAVDYKAPYRRYRDICGPMADAEKVLQTIRVLNESGARFEVRTTVIPQLSELDLIRMAKELPQLQRYVLNKYRPPQKYQLCHRDLVNQPPYTQGQIEAFTHIVRPFQPNATT
jgi:pyruvate formate lyase activating enzyme